MGSKLLHGRGCTTISDYSIEVGLVHSSGVSCLVEKTALQRVSCASQYHDGLRCYSFQDAPTFEAPLVGETTLATDAAAQTVLETYCLYQAEEFGNDADPRCQTVSGYQG